MAKSKKNVRKKTPQKNTVSYAESLVYANRGNACLAERKLDEAIKSYQQALFFKPDFAEVHNNLGVALQQRGNIDLAIQCHQRAIALKPNYPDAYQNLALAFQAQKKTDLAIENQLRALALKPDYTQALDDLVYTRLKCCDWTDYEKNRQTVLDNVRQNKPGHSPFEFFALSDNPAEQLACAATFINHYAQASKTPVWTGNIYQHDKIRIAYISGDFREHPVAYLMAGLLDLHSRKQFEIIGISLKPEHDTAIGQRVKNAFDQFIDVSKSSNYEIALLLKKLEVDIAVDLMGLTGKSRTAIFAYRPVPIQINYLGFPATMGADYIDYIIADHYLILPQHVKHYREKVVYLPDCFQVCDDKREISPVKFTRSEQGLPENCIVFCCFNNSYKITPEFFATWMRLLKAVPDSVLWLLSGNELMTKNLRQQAEKLGVHPKRLIFANSLKNTEHLARFQLADIFLDTLPVNAGATASDALWVGVPIITCSGESMVSRMAGSLLHAIGLPELVAHSLADYESLALKLATHPEELAAIKTKLAQNRLSYPLFNTQRFTRHLEAAYTTMWERIQRGESPVSFSVPAME